MVSFLNVFLFSKNEGQCKRAAEWIENVMSEGSPVPFDQDLLGLASQVYVQAGNPERALELIAPFS